MKFSQEEWKSLGKAWLFVTFAFAIYLSSRFAGFATVLLTAAIGVGLGFLLHELAHKYVAQKYGLQAHFKSFDKMLWVSLLLSPFIILLAPGAVMVSARDRIRLGRIAVAGPIVNIILCVLFLLISIPFPSPFVRMSAAINAYLAFFNMLPVWALDGKKVLAWDKRTFGVVLAVSVVLLFVTGL